MMQPRPSTPIQRPNVYTKVKISSNTAHKKGPAIPADKGENQDKDTNKNDDKDNSNGK